MEDAKEEIRARLAVEDVVGQYIELKRAGRNFKGHSPWGTDRTPSFMVSPDKGIWHDFSSNKGGDIFTFVMEMEGCTFREALEKLAQQAGVELRRYSGDDKKQAAHKARLFEVLELATKYFQYCLSKNKSVMQYVFYKRNMNKKTVENFRIGYAPQSGDALKKFLIKRGFTKQEMEDAGLLNQYGGDLFRGRMTIPLMDVGGRVIGFTARILNDKDKNSPKYLNTPETILYNKGRHIFGLSQAKDAIRRTDYVVVVEGNMDVISSHQAGVNQAVATAGTAMTEMHLKSFARMTKDIRLAYDGDEAGIRAAERAISMASKFGIYLSVIDDAVQYSRALGLGDRRLSTALRHDLQEGFKITAVVQGDRQDLARGRRYIAAAIRLRTMKMSQAFAGQTRSFRFSCSWQSQATASLFRGKNISLEVM